MLDEKLLQERLSQFNPDPLVEYTEDKTKEELEIHMVLEDDKTIDLAKMNYLNVLNDEEIKKTSEDIIRKYGVGTCGPRAFYGTTDVHLELEQHLADFLNMEESIVYSYGFVAISSSIAAYCKKKDIIFVDKEANFAIQQGLVAAKSKVIHFDHNSAASFLEEVKKVMENPKLAPARKFLIIEGVSWKTGKICQLEEFLQVTEKYKIRIFLEESYSLGVLGENGRGLTEYYNIDPARIDMIFGTLEGAVGSIGGFCAGSSLIIEHQRLSGSGYIFSASLPTYLVKAVIKSVETFGVKPHRLVAFAREFQAFLDESCGFEVDSSPDSPFKVFSSKDELFKEKNVQIHKYCKENGVYFILKDDKLVINLSIALNEDKNKLKIVQDVLQRAAIL